LLIVPVLLIFIEPDRGTTILLAAVSATMLLVSGVQWKYLSADRAGPDGAGHFALARPDADRAFCLAFPGRQGRRRLSGPQTMLT
jgi:hypothetical protein